MNITQRRYAVQRIYEILKEKCLEIRKDDTLKFKKLDDSLKLSNEDLLRKIRNNEINTKPLKNVSKNTYHRHIEDFFDMSNVVKEHTNALISAGYLIDKEGHIVSEYITLAYPSKPEISKPFNVYHPDNIKKIEKAQRILNDLSDKIMLANQKEVREAIAKVDKITL